MDDRPGPWLREGRLIYELQSAGWKKGVERFENRWMAHVQPGRGTDAKEAERIAALMHAAPELKQLLANLVTSHRHRWNPDNLIVEAEALLTRLNGGANG